MKGNKSTSSLCLLTCIFSLNDPNFFRDCLGFHLRTFLEDISRGENQNFDIFLVIVSTDEGEIMLF